jgi:hypothetical protein
MYPSPLPEAGNMSSLLRPVLVLSLATSLFGGRLYATPKTAVAPSAPIPSSILSANKVFVANGGGDESLFDPQ